MTPSRQHEVSVWFGDIVYRLFAPSVRHYTDILLQRVVPIFENVEAEQNRVADAILNSPHWGPDDYDAAMEAAFEESRDHAVEFMEMRSVFLAAGVSGLFHLFERQIYKHLNHELRDWLEAPISEWKSATDIIRRLVNRYGEGDPEELQRHFSSPDLVELRLVANALKHGEGTSYDALRRMCAVVVSPERIDNDWTVGPFSILNVSIAVEPSDVERYRDAILQVWRTEGTYWNSRSAFEHA